MLTGALAVADCKLKAHETHCEHLRTNTVDEILAMYDKLCGHQRATTRTTTPMVASSAASSTSGITTITTTATAVAAMRTPMTPTTRRTLALRLADVLTG